MTTANDRLLDSAINHKINLEHYANGVVRRMIAVLNRADTEMSQQLMLALDSLPKSAFTVERLEQLLGSVYNLNTQAYAELNQRLHSELRNLAEHEVKFQDSAVRKSVPNAVVANITIAQVGVKQVFSAAVARPLQGRLMSEWAQSLSVARATRLRDAIRMGYVENQTNDEILRRVRGSRAKAYADGALNIDRANAAAVVQTAVAHTAAVARQEFYSANSELIKAVQWVSTLDSRTSPACAIRDGKTYHAETHAPIKHTYPWGGGPGMLHWNCRSTSVPVLKSWAELGIDVETNPETRASMDGQVPVDMTYTKWLKKQSAARQIEVLGVTRYKLYKQGMPFSNFMNNKGVWLTLDELAVRDGL